MNVNSNMGARVNRVADFRGFVMSVFLGSPADVPLGTGFSVPMAGVVTIGADSNLQIMDSNCQGVTHVMNDNKALVTALWSPPPAGTGTVTVRAPACAAAYTSAYADTRIYVCACTYSNLILQFVRCCSSGPWSCTITRTRVTFTAFRFVLLKYSVGFPASPRVLAVAVAV